MKIALRQYAGAATAAVSAATGLPASARATVTRADCDLIRSDRTAASMPSVV